MDSLSEKEAQEFNENFNISYIKDEGNTNIDAHLILKHYFSSLFIYGLCLTIYWCNPFFATHLGLFSKQFFLYFYFAYAIISPFIYFIFKPKSIINSHSIAICEYLRKITFNNPNFRILTSREDIIKCIDYYKPTYHQQQSLFLLLIKFFFGALMVEGLIHNIFYMNDYLPKYCNAFNNLFLNIKDFDWNGLAEAVWGYREALYSHCITLLFTFDLMFFSIGYMTELGFLKNKIRSVETTPAGILFCIICYPPFFLALSKFTGSHANEYSHAFGDIASPVTWIFRIIGLVFLFLYVCASAALGTKASNLTNRGTVSCFPYNIVRHPAYISKNIFWIVTLIPLFIVDFNAQNFDLLNYLNKLLSILITCVVFVLIYYFRAITEERHLLKDPEYRAYVKKVKYRFIPKIL